MASAINEIYDAIAAYDVYWDSDVSIKVREIQNLKDSIDTPEGPVRLLSPVDPLAGGLGGHIALGPTAKYTWYIVDTLYLRPTSHGGSLRNSMPQIMNYVKSYLEVVRLDRSPTSQSYVEEMSWEPGVFSWPSSAGDPYYGVRFSLTVHEVVS